MSLLINSIAHFLVDALCVTTLFSGGLEGAALSEMAVLYNTLAFSTQCLTGLLADRLRGYLRLDVAAMLLTVLGFFLPLPFAARIAVVGLGNSLFHVAAGTMTLTESGGKAWQLGVFVAPGAFGVTLGTSYPVFGAYLAAALLVCAGALCLARRGRGDALPAARREGKLPLAPVLLLTAAVAVRAVGGAAVSFPWKNTVLLGFVMTAFVFAGKAAGGFVCDRFGPEKTALLSVPLAALCIAFFSGSMPLSLLGQLLLNLTMPVTLWLLYQAMPDAPGFAFGLAASALWPGTIVGQLFRLTGPALWLCVALSFCFGLFAILFSCKKLRLAKTERKNAS